MASKTYKSAKTMLEELNGKYQALLQEKRALEVRLSRAEKAPERNREPGETSANPDVNPTAERQRTSRETRNPANPEPSAGDSRLTTVLERLLESRESPKVEKYYELPKVMDKPALSCTIRRYAYNTNPYNTSIIRNTMTPSSIRVLYGYYT